MTAAPRIVTRFDATSTADDVVKGVDLRGKHAIVTGGASGIGIETARSLARAGASVTLAVRDVKAAAPVVKDLESSTGRHFDVRAVDLADRAAVAHFVHRWQGPLHLLINNAGVMATPLTRTPEGWELQFATNHLGHFGLTLGLREALKAAEGARVINVSSSGHLRAPVDFDDLHFDRRAYDPWVAYGQSKTANILFSVELTKRWAKDGIVSNALMPGAIATNLQRHIDDATRARWKKMEEAGTFVWKTQQQGASTTLIAAVAPEFAAGGAYLEDGNEAEEVDDDAKVGKGQRKWAKDPAAAERLWDVSIDHLQRPLPKR